MGRDRNLPDFFAEVHDDTRTPYLALMASGGLIIFMALAIPIEDVAAAADVMFLLLFLQVNVAIITIRRKYGDKLDYGFLIPFFPVLPIVAIVLMLGIALFMFHFSPVAWYFVIGWIGTGLAIHYGYARHREREKRVTPVVHVEAPGPEEERYRVLVPVANPARAGALIDLACMLAADRDGEVVLLHAITVPDQTPLEVGHRYVRQARDEVLDRAVEMAEAKDVPTRSVIRIGHKPSEAIVHEVEDRDVDLVVMGWRGRSRHRHTRIGSNIDVVMRHADCHVAVLRADDLDALRHVLVPVAYVEQARLMLEIGHVLEERRGADLRLYHAVPEGMAEDERRARLDALHEGLADLDVRPDTVAEARHLLHVEDTDRVVDRIVEQSADHDLTMIGAAREGWLRKLVAGTKPEQIARRATGRLLLVKHRRSPIQSRVLDTIEFFRSGDPERLT